MSERGSSSLPPLALGTCSTLPDGAGLCLCRPGRSLSDAKVHNLHFTIEAHHDVVVKHHGG